jgi:hypothetical protein
LREINIAGVVYPRVARATKLAKRSVGGVVTIRAVAGRGPSKNERNFVAMIGEFQS